MNANRRIWITALCGACGLLGATVVSETTKADGPEVITTVEGITEYRLDNGMKVLLFPDESKPKVTLALTVFVGSRHEGYGEAGMAHLLEHMLFKGTPDHPNVPKVLQEHGAQFNGTTWLDRTNYYETMPASDENLEFAIRLEADRMMNSKVLAEDLASEMTVVRNEFERGENEPSRILFQKMMTAAYEWHNYGNSTIGNRADIERVPIEALRTFYRKYYQPDNAMVVVAGKFDPAKALEYIEKYFGSIPRPERTLPSTYTEEPAQDGERTVTLRRVGDVAQVGALYHIPSAGHPDYVPLDVLERILTAPSSGRLYKALVERQLASSVSGAAFALYDPGIMRFMAEVAPGNDPRDVLSQLLDIVESSGDTEISPEEVERAKTYWLKEWELLFSESNRIAIQLSEWQAQGDWRLLFLYRDRLEEVTVEDVARVAKNYLRQNNRTAGLFIPTEQPERVEVPPTPELASMIGDYTGREAVATGEAFDVSPQNIEERTERYELPGGLKVTLLPKKTRGGSVNFRLVLRYGDEHNLQGLTTAVDVLPLLMARGTKNLTRQQIQDRLDNLRTRLAPNGSTGEANFVLQTKNEYLADALDVLRQILREPTLPQDEFEIIRTKQITSLEQNLTDPTALARTFVVQKISPYPPEDVRYVPSVPESIERWKNLSRDEVAQLYTEYLGGTEGELAIVGDFDPDLIKPILERIFSDWDAEESYEHISRDGDIDLAAEREAIETPDKPNAMYLAASVFPLSDADPAYPALLIGNHILGSSGLSSRLGDRVRQQEGLSYGVGSGMTAQSLDPRTTLTIYAITNPANMGKVETAIREEIERLRKEGITAEELDAAKQGFLEEQKVVRAEDSRLAEILTGTAHTGRTMQYYADLQQQIGDLTIEDVNAAVRKYIDPQRIVVGVAGDFASVGNGQNGSTNE
jgi:zinc protease